MAKQPALTYYAQTMPGVEEIAWLEIRQRLDQATFGEYLFAKEQNGIVLFDYSGPVADLLRLRTTEDVFLLGDSWRVSRGKQDLREISARLQQSESLGQAANALLRHRRYSHPPTFRVISRQYGQHQYRRKDLEAAVLRGLQIRYPRWVPVADESQVEVWANLLGSRLLVGLRLSDRTMRHRHAKRVELPASLRPSLAAAMVFLSRPAADDIFLDPLCGSGTILLERLAAGPYERLLAGDIDSQRVYAARQNVLVPGQTPGPERVNIRRWDARSLPLDKSTISKVVTNLPFGKQISEGHDLQALYAGLFAELARVVRPGGRLVLLSSEFDLLKSCVREQPSLTILGGYSVATLGKWARIYILEQSR